MNIQQAKEQITGAVRAYLSKDDIGNYRIPQRMQRPIIMFGPPGVGKTAIASQIADELGINFVAYSITHHTRQSALGLPYITTDEFDGREQRVSDYTMSEIIASVHRAAKESGVAQGILFLDEVNCVSETLAPAMLQFLQFKTFGMHRLPDGWVIVCAGNPPEYNRAAREFDPALLDRIKRIEVDPDISVWQSYAASAGVHPAITTFLDAKPSLFYLVRQDVRGPHLVTARGWEDLSRMLQTYEAEGIEVDEHLVGQYIQDEQVALEFGAYYDLFRSYQDDYRIADVLDGAIDDGIVQRLHDAAFDERIAVVGMLVDAQLERVHALAGEQEALAHCRSDIQTLASIADPSDVQDCLARWIRDATRESAHASQHASATSYRAHAATRRAQILEDVRQQVAKSAQQGQPSFEAARQTFNDAVDAFEARTTSTMASIEHAFRFLDEACGDNSQEALVMVTKLSADPALVQAVVEHGCPSYLEHSKSLLLSERELDIARRIEDLKQQAHDVLPKLG